MNSTRQPDDPSQLASVAWRVGRISCGGSAAFSGAGVPAILGRPGEAVESHVPEAGRGAPDIALNRRAGSRRRPATTLRRPSGVWALPASMVGGRGAGCGAVTI